MFIPDPDIYASRMPDPWSNNSNKRGEGKKLVVLAFDCNYKFHNIENYVIFEHVQKKFKPIQRIT